MQVTKEPIDPCQIALTIEVETDKVVLAVNKAYREYAKYVSVPGFRKGKAPMNFVKQRVPETDVRQRAAELLVEPAYAEAIEQEAIQPYAQPKLELLQLDLTDKPFIFKAVVPLPPKVELGTYTGLTVERNNYQLSDEDVDGQIERLRQRAAEYPKVERPSEKGDLMIAEVGAEVEARPEAATPRPTMIEIGAENIPGFDEQIIGLSVGDEKSFTLSYPEDYPEEDLAGQEAEFSVKVTELRAKEVPPLDDELAKKITAGKIETLDALKTDLRKDMERSLSESSEREVETKIVDQVVSGSTINFPPALTEAELEDDWQSLQTQLQRDSTTLEAYLEQVGKTREQLIQEFVDAARKRIYIGLALGEIAEKESLTLTEADVDAEIAAQAERQQTTPAALRAVIERNDGLVALRNRAQTKKVLDFLKAATIMEDKTVQANQRLNEPLEEEDEEENEQNAPESETPVISEPSPVETGS